MRISDVQVTEFNGMAVKTGGAILTAYFMFFLSKLSLLAGWTVFFAILSLVACMGGWCLLGMLHKCRNAQYEAPSFAPGSDDATMTKLSLKADTVYHKEPWVADLVKVVDPESAAIFEMKVGEDGEGALERACCAEKKRQAAIVSGCLLLLSAVSLLETVVLVHAALVGVR